MVCTLIEVFKLVNMGTTYVLDSKEIIVFRGLSADL